MRTSQFPSRRHQLAYGALGLLFVVSVTYRTLHIAEQVGELRHGREYVRDPFASTCRSSS